MFSSLCLLNYCNNTHEGYKVQSSLFFVPLLRMLYHLLGYILIIFLDTFNTCSLRLKDGFVPIEHKNRSIFLYISVFAYSTLNLITVFPSV